MRQLRDTIAAQPRAAQLRLLAASVVTTLVLAHQAAHALVPGFSCFRYH
jgi:hypothetical protein